MSVLGEEVALVTGASRGVGAAIADALAGEGASVVVNYWRSEELAEGVSGGIRAHGGGAIVHRADVTVEGTVRGMVEAAVGEFGPVDVLVNNALPGYGFDPVGRKDFGSISWGLPAAAGGARGRGPLLAGRRAGDGRGGRGWDHMHPLEPHKQPRRRLPRLHDRLERPPRLLSQPRRRARPHNITVNMVAGGLIGGTDASAPTTEEVCRLVAGSTLLRRLALGGLRYGAVHHVRRRTGCGVAASRRLSGDVGSPEKPTRGKRTWGSEGF